MDEALSFVRSLPLKVQQKITYNYKKIEQGVMDKELVRNGYFDCRHTWYSQEDTKDSSKGNNKGRRD